MTEFLSMIPNWRSPFFLMLTALITILVFSLTDFVGAHSRIGNTFETIAVERAENAVAISQGISTDEMKSRIEQKCFQGIGERTFDEGGILSSLDQRRTAENTCSKIAMASPNKIRKEASKLRFQFWGAMSVEILWRFLFSALSILSVLIALKCWLSPRT